MSELTPSPDSEEERSDPKYWGRFYGTVIAELAILILLFYLFTKTFA